MISPWYSGLGAICALRTAPEPVELCMVSSGKSVTGSRLDNAGLGGITFNILPSRSKNAL